LYGVYNQKNQKPIRIRLPCDHQRSAGQTDHLHETFNRKTEAKVWADRIDSDRDAIAAYGNKGVKMSFTVLVNEYMLQWHGKDQEHQQQRAMYWAN